MLLKRGASERKKSRGREGEMKRASERE